MSTAGAAWTEHRTPEGRPYWYHTTERRSVWEKPSELKTPRERALEATPWKEYKSGERSYYVHSVTKQSTWTLPDELRQILDQYPLDSSAAGPQTASSPHLNNNGTHQSPAAFARSPAAAASPAPIMDNATPAEPSHPSGARINHALSPTRLASGSNTPFTPNPTTASTTTIQTMSGATELNFKGDKLAAESAFLQLLSETGVDINWTWETTMRTIITNPLYKALKTIAERKAAFNKYLDSLRQKRAVEARERLEQLKPFFKQLVEKDSRIKSYSSFATAKKFLGHTEGWKRAKGDEEAKVIFEEVMKERREAEKEEEKKLRGRNMKMLMALLRTFEADVFTRWRDAHRTIIESQEYLDDPHLPSMDISDMLIVFEDLMKDIEKDFDLSKRKEAIAKRRKERQNRDAFKALLQSLEKEGKIRARSTWGEIFPLIKDHPSFLRVVGQPGSTPLDLFFDLVDSLDQTLEAQTADALQHASKLGHEVKPSTTQSEFLTWTAGCGVPEVTLRQIFSELVAYLAEEEEKKENEERRRLERKHRHKIEDLRYAFKKVDPTLDLDEDWEEVKGRVEGLKEYKEAMEEDERIPRWAWEKFVRRQREKELESQQADGRKRKDPPQASAGNRRDSTSAGLTTEKVASSAVKRVRRSNDDDEESEPEEGEV